MMIKLPQRKKACNSKTGKMFIYRTKHIIIFIYEDVYILHAK